VEVQAVDSAIRWVPVRTVAKALKVSRQRVYTLVHDGALVSVMQDGCRLISLRSLNDLIEARAKRKGV
jgi:hypothetical protein